MLLRVALLFLFSACLVFSQDPTDSGDVSDDVFDDFDPDAILVPMGGDVGDPGSSNEVRALRGLLGARHNECPPYYAECPNEPGK